MKFSHKHISGQSLGALLSLTLMISLTGTPMHSYAYSHFEDEDTILVEKQPSQKIPYAKIIRKIGKRLFQVDTYKIASFGQGKTTKVMRNLKDFAERSKYRVNVREDELEFKYTLNF